MNGSIAEETLHLEYVDWGKVEMGKLWQMREVLTSRF